MQMDQFHLYILELINQTNAVGFFRNICLPLYAGILTVFVFVIPLSMTIIENYSKGLIKYFIMEDIRNYIHSKKALYTISTTLLFSLLHISIYAFKLNNLLIIFNFTSIIFYIASISITILFVHRVFFFYFENTAFLSKLYNKKLFKSKKNKSISVDGFNYYFINKYTTYLKEDISSFNNDPYTDLIDNDYEIISKELNLSKAFESNKKVINNKSTLYETYIWNLPVNIYRDTATEIYDHNLLRSFLYIYRRIIRDNVDVIKGEQLEYITFFCLYYIAYINYRREDLKLLEASLYSIEHNICSGDSLKLIKEKYPALIFKITQESLKLAMKSMTDSSDKKIEICMRHLYIVKRSLSTIINKTKNSYSNFYNLSIPSQNNFENLDVMFNNYYNDLIICLLVYSDIYESKNLKENININKQKLNNIDSLKSDCKLWASIIRLSLYSHDNKLSPIELMNNHKLNDNKSTIYSQWNFGFTEMLSVRKFIPVLLELLYNTPYKLFNIKSFIKDSGIELLINDKTTRSSLIDLLNGFISTSNNDIKYKNIKKQAEEIKEHLMKKYYKYLAEVDIPEEKITEAAQKIQKVLKEEIIKVPILGSLNNNLSKDDINQKTFSRTISLSKADWLDKEIPISSGNDAIEILTESGIYNQLSSGFINTVLYNELFSKVSSIRKHINTEKECLEYLKERVDKISNPIILYNNNNNKMEWLYDWFDDIRYDQSELLKDVDFTIDPSLNKRSEGLEYLGNLKFNSINKTTQVYYSPLASMNEKENDQIIILSKDIFKNFYYEFANKKPNEILREDTNANKAIFHVDIFYELIIDKPTSKNINIIKLKNSI